MESVQSYLSSAAAGILETARTRVTLGTVESCTALRGLWNIYNTSFISIASKVAHFVATTPFKRPSLWQNEILFFPIKKSVAHDVPSLFGCRHGRTPRTAETWSPAEPRRNSLAIFRPEKEKRKWMNILANKQILRKECVYPVNTTGTQKIFCILLTQLRLYVFAKRGSFLKRQKIWLALVLRKWGEFILVESTSSKVLQIWGGGVVVWDSKGNILSFWGGAENVS